MEDIALHYSIEEIESGFDYLVERMMRRIDSDSVHPVTSLQLLVEMVRKFASFELRNTLFE